MVPMGAAQGFRDDGVDQGQLALWLLALVFVLVSGIARSAQQQAAGLSQVNSSVSGMEKILHQSVAMVDSTVASTQVLNDDAGRLKALLDQFKLGRRGRPVDTLEAGRAA